MATAKKTDPSRFPSVKTSGRSEKPLAARSQAKPVATMSMPTRLSGRRPHANRPTPMKLQPTTSAAAPQAPGGSAESLVSISARTASPNAKPAAASAQRARRRLVIRASQKRLQRRAGKLRLRDEAADALALAERAEVVHVAARGQDDRGGVPVGREAGGHLEAVDVGQLYVEQDYLGS